MVRSDVTLRVRILPRRRGPSGCGGLYLRRGDRASRESLEGKRGFPRHQAPVLPGRHMASTANRPWSTTSRPWPTSPGSSPTVGRLSLRSVRAGPPAPAFSRWPARSQSRHLRTRNGQDDLSATYLRRRSSAVGSAADVRSRPSSPGVCRLPGSAPTGRSAARSRRSRVRRIDAWFGLGRRHGLRRPAWSGGLAYHRFFHPRVVWTVHAVS